MDLHDPANPWTLEDEVSMFGLKLPVIEAGPLEPMPGLIDLVSQLKANGLQLAVASSSRRSKIDIVLRKVGLTDTFDAIVSGEDEIKHGKPAPDIFS